MRTTIETLPIAHEKLGEMVRGQDWGGTTSAYMEYPTGLDFGRTRSLIAVRIRNRTSAPLAKGIAENQRLFPSE